MSLPPLCPRCRGPLSAGILGGLCPGCLLREGAGAASLSGPSTPFTPPAVSELAAVFPQLEILELIGQGGMGAVYRARQLSLDRLVALKILAPSPGEEFGFSERFTREARALARLNHPAIVAVHEFGQAGRFHFFLMEFVDGPNLRQLQKHSRLSARQALEIVPQICDALQYAHDQGIVHRDIKPENILVDRRGRVKIADFGLSKIVGADLEALRLTGEGHIMGTPHYMAPEQIEHPLEVDHRADIYSLGVVFYEMLTAELPLGRFSPPSQRVHLDVRLDEIVLRALEKQPELRYQQASEVRSGLATVSASAPEGGPVAPSMVTNPPSSTAPLFLTWAALFIPFVFTLVALRSEHAAGWWLAALSALLVVAALITLWPREGKAFATIFIRAAIAVLLLFAAATGLYLCQAPPPSKKPAPSPNVASPADGSLPGLPTAQPASASAPLAAGQIQLVEIAEHPSGSKARWVPSGLPAIGLPFTDEGAHSYPSPEQKARDFVFRLTGWPPDSSALAWRIDHAASTVGGGEPKRAGHYAQGFVLVSAIFSRDVKTTAIRAGVAAGPWEVVLEDEGAGSLGAGTTFRGLHVSVSFLEPVETRDGNTIATVSHSAVDFDTRLVAVDAAGILRPAVAARAYSSGELVQRTFEFPGLPRASIVKLLFQARPYSWTEFHRVPLEPAAPPS